MPFKLAQSTLEFVEARDVHPTDGLSNYEISVRNYADQSPAQKLRPIADFINDWLALDPP